MFVMTVFTQWDPAPLARIHWLILNTLGESDKIPRLNSRLLENILRV